MPTNQLGFCSNTVGTLEQILNLMNLIQQAKVKQQGYRANKTRVVDRVKQYCLFIDASNAFDSVRKDKLLEIMTKAGYNTTLVEALRGLLVDTEIIVNGVTIKTLRGTP